jgi:transposase
MTIPGIGPIAVVAAIGSGSTFMRGRDFAAWLGLVPRQMSTGDRTILGRITKRGNGYLRMLFMQAARVVLLRPTSWPKHDSLPTYDLTWPPVGRQVRRLPIIEGLLQRVAED